MYQPHRTTLCLHQWVVEKGRICDIIILALHEVVGHYYQEKNTYTTSAQAENCAMMCEALVNNVMGSPCCAIEWKIMRYCRALLPVHTHVMESTYTLPRMYGMSGQKINNALRFVVPLPSETFRVAALPGQALTCIRVRKARKGVILRACLLLRGDFRTCEDVGSQWSPFVIVTKWKVRVKFSAPKSWQYLKESIHSKEHHRP